MKRTDRNPHCPVNVTLELVGDPWSLLIVRDIVFHGKHTFGEFVSSDERITTSVLADRLAMLVREGILAKSTPEHDRRREDYSLTDKGLSLIPILVELANWGVSYGDQVTPDPLWVDAARTDPMGLRALIHQTVAAGGAVWVGDDSVASQLARSAEQLPGHGGRSSGLGAAEPAAW